jgi:hypothetical protein
MNKEKGRGETNDSRDGSEIEEWKEKTHGKRVRKAVWAQEGRISDRRSYRRLEFWNRNCHYSAGKDDRGKGP